MTKSITIIEQKLELFGEQKIQLEPITLATLITEFIALGEFSVNTRDAYTNDLKKLWNFTQGNLSDGKLLEFKHFVIMHDDGEPRAPRSANRMLASTRRFLDYLVHRRIISSNIYANSFTGKGKRVDKQDSPYVALTDAEVRLMLDHRDPNDRQDSALIASSKRMAFMLGFYLGLRVSEICMIRYKDITSDSIRIVGKGNKARNLPLSETLLNAINEHLLLVATLGATPSPEHYLVQSRESGGVSPANRSTVWRWFTSTASDVGITKHFSPHSARATAITKALEGGAGIRDVAAMAGHSNIDTTSIYDKRREEGQKRALGAIKY